MLQLLEISSGYPALKTPRQSKQGHFNASKESDKQGDSMSNMFSYLNIYEPMNDAPGMPSTSKPQTSKSGASKLTASNPEASKVDFELEEQDGDRSFAVWCLLYDIGELRQEVRTHWLKYRNGNISFSAVAEMSANAITMTQYASYNSFARVQP